MPEQFVNPSPYWRVTRLLFFDFPCLGSDPVDYTIPGAYRATAPAPGCSPNINLAATETQLVYGAGGPPEPGLFPGGRIGLGTPPCQQGHPFMKEFPSPEVADPPTVDQIVDIDRGLQIDHTARLSGGLVQFIANDSFRSEVEVSALPVTNGGPGFQLCPPIVRTLAPKPMKPNEWFWRPTGRNELLFSAQVVIQPGGMPGIGFVREQTYKLVYQWKFWYAPTGQRMPISGFDEAIAFQVISQTIFD